MKVITGSARGRNLKTLDGLDTRPTSDMLKQAIFNIIQFDIEGRRVLDLFSGSGQLAVEALSRGAASAVCVDNSPNAINIIKENLTHTKLSHLAQTFLGDGINFLKTTGQKFDIIFIDPPYSSDLAQTALEKIYEFDILSIGGIIVIEKSTGTILPDAVPPYFKGKEYVYSKKCVAIYGKEG